MKKPQPFGAGGGDMISLFASIDREIPPGPPDVARLAQLAEQNGVALAP